MKHRIVASLFFTLATGALAGDVKGPAAKTVVAAVAPEQASMKTAQVTPLASRDVIERLKSLRSEIVLEEENIRLLKARLQRIELEGQIASAQGKAKPSGAAPASASARSVPRPSTVDPENELVVKAVTVSPFKEAIVMYRSRVYTVRPGDHLGPIEIKDVTESGLVTASAGVAARAVLMNH